MARVKRPKDYVGTSQVLARYKFSRVHLWRLRMHDDLDLRFPAPTLVLGRLLLWDSAVLDEYDDRQRELSKDRFLPGPQQHDGIAIGRPKGRQNRAPRADVEIAG